MLVAHTSDAHIDHTPHAVTPAQRQAALQSNFMALSSVSLLDAKERKWMCDQLFRDDN